MKLIRSILRAAFAALTFAAACPLFVLPALAGEPPGPEKPAGAAGEKKPGQDEEAEALKAAKERLEKLDPETRKVLDLIDATHRKIESFSAEYRQVRKVKIRRNPVISTGSIYVKKQGEGKSMKVLFVEEKPSKSRVLFTDEEIVFQDCQTGEVKRNDPRQGSVQPSEIWVLGRPVIDIVRFYEPKLLPAQEDESEKYMGRLELVPVSEKVRKWVKRIVVWMRPGDALGVKVRIEDHGGDYQEFDFDQGRLKMNPELADDLFKIE